MKLWIALAVLAVCASGLNGCAASDALLAMQGLPTAASRPYASGEMKLEASPPTRTEPVKPDAEAALVIGWGDSVTEGLKSAVSYAPGARITELYIFRVDGKKVSRTGGIARLSAGRHELELQCVLHLGGMRWGRQPTMVAEVKNGHVYELHAHNEAQSCVPSLRELDV